jgi:hypothetical protein
MSGVCCGQLAGCGSSAVTVIWDAMAVRVFCRNLRWYSNQLSGSIPSTLGSLGALT